MKYFTFLIAALLSSTALAEGPSTSLTIYSKAAPGEIGVGMPAAQVPGYALVRSEREIEIPEKKTTVEFGDVAAYIDPTTVVFSSLTDPEGAHVTSQNYLFDVASNEAILKRYIGHDIDIEQTVGAKIEHSVGKLLSTEGGIILQEPGGKIKTITSYSAIRFPILPEGLMAKPTLLWEIDAAKTGPQTIQVNYQTAGISWWTDYNIVLSEGKDANQGLLDINAWVSIINQSGVTYTDSKLKLMAGDVHRIEPPRQKRPMMAMMAMDAGRAAPAFDEKAFFEYHLYTLNNVATLPNNSTKQLELFPAIHHVPAAVVYEFNGQENDKVTAYITFQNNSNYGLGIPLPAGRIRVSKRDPQDGNLEFIGEDAVSHTPKNEEVKITLGKSFDITGKRVVVAERGNNEQKWSEEDVQITLKNHKDVPVTLIVEEPLNKSPNWKISNQSIEYEKAEAKSIKFPIKLEKEGEQKVTYTVRYTW